MIKEIRLHNITCFTDLTLSVGALNIIYGPDGSGKSTIKDAIELLITGKCPGRESPFLRLGAIEGTITADIDLNGHPRLLEKNLKMGSTTNGGVSQSVLLKELKVTKPALELLADVWSVLRKSEKDLTTTINRALAQNMSRDEVIELIVEHVEAEHKVAARTLLQEEIKKTTADTLATAKTKISKRLNGIDGKIEEAEKEKKVLEGKLALLKNVNMEKVQQARLKIQIENQIKERENTLQTREADLKKLEKDLDDANKELAKHKKIDLLKLQQEVANLNSEININSANLAAIPGDLEVTGNLNCKWFGTCQLDEKHMIDVVKQARDNNRNRKSALQLESETLQEKLGKAQKKLDDAKNDNEKYDTAEGKVSDLTEDISDKKDWIKTDKDFIEAQKKLIPIGVDGIGDALFTMADEAQKIGEQVSTLNTTIQSEQSSKPILDACLKALESSDDELKATKTTEFIEQAKENLAFIFGKTITYDETSGYRIGDIPISWMSMSQKQRVGLALQHATAKVTGVPIMIVDDMNIITNYERVGKFIKDAVLEDKMTVFLFSSIKGVDKAIGLDTANIVTLGE